MTTDPKFKLILLWLFTTIGMILHFNYHVGEIFYGIDIVRPEATGEVPIGVFVIRSVFYHLPFIWMLLIVYVKNALLKPILFGISLLYLLSHGAHLAGELSQEQIDPSQTSLLALVLVVAGMLSTEHYLWWKKSDSDEAAA